MSLSELVARKNELEALTTSEAKQFADMELGKFTHLLQDATLNSNLISVGHAFQHFDNTVARLAQDLREAIVSAERPWFQESYRLHEEEIWRHPAEHIFNVCLAPVHADVKEVVAARLNLYASWHHAGMFIRPGKETFVNQLVSFDPLYVVDRDVDLLAPSVQQFAPEYQTRLRQYTVDDVNNASPLSKIPNNQFGICVAYMYFNYKPFEVIKTYFAEIYQKLKPGGMFCFTFNDCDRVAAVKLVEQRFCCYTPGYLVRELAQTLGFEIKYVWNNDGPITWLELKKPGELTSLKGGQTLAKIIPK